jgi:polyisoprenoid-binding protein YceI
VVSEGEVGRAAAPAGAAALLTDGSMAGKWVLDSAGSRTEFAVKHFWGAITVRGSFTSIAGEGSVGADGSVTGQLTLKAASLTTGNKQRDKHLRSADFFDADNHDEVIITVTQAKPAGPEALACEGTLEAAGHVRPLTFTAQIVAASAEAVVLTAEIAVDRTEFAMTWSPMRIASATALGTVTARFIRP